MVPKTNLRLSDSLKEPTELNKIVILRITVFAMKGYRLKINNGKKAYKADEGQAPSCLLPGKSHRQNFIFPARVCSNLHFPSTEAYLSIDVRIFILEVNNVGMSSSGQLTDIVWPKAHTITHTVSTDNLVWPKFLHPTSPS